MTELSDDIKKLRELIDEADYYEIGERLYRRGSYLLVKILEAAEKAERYEKALKRLQARAKATGDDFMLLETTEALAPEQEKEIGG